jgi:hypothetical protein
MSGGCIGRVVVTGRGWRAGRGWMLFCLLLDGKEEQEKIAAAMGKVKEEDDGGGGGGGRARGERERKRGSFFSTGWKKNWHAAQQTAEKDVK